jgi:predicted metal-dependent hydrolase
MINFDKRELEARRIPFEFPSDIEPCWIPHDPELSSMINAASLTMPYLEPFLMRTIREVKGKTQHFEQLQKDIAGFIAQEGQHYQAHRRFNELLKQKRYPEIDQLESQMHDAYTRLSTRSLRTRMAYTAGFEAMTLGLTKWIVGDRVKLFAEADTRVTSFVLWHMVEETEHKRVAHDAYVALFGRSFGSYCARAFGVFHGSFDVMRFSMKGYKMMLKKDGRWSNLKSRIRLSKRLSQFVWHVSPYLLRAALPFHSPHRERDLDWVIEWLEGYDAHLKGSTVSKPVPDVDTSHPKMPVPFPKTNSEAVV